MDAPRNERMYTGIGLVLGCGLGTVFGLLLLTDWWLGAGIGTALGLVAGAAMDALR
jgi:uncharacterized membrane protein YccC